MALSLRTAVQYILHRPQRAYNWGLQVSSEDALKADGSVNAFVFTALRQHKLSGLAEMLRFIAECFDAYACILWRLAPGGDLGSDPAQGRLFVLAQWLQDQCFWSSHNLTLDSNTGDAIRTNTPVCVPDVSTDSRIEQSDPLWAVAGVKTFCSVPVVFLDGQRGAVNVYRVSQEFTSGDISRIQALADLVPSLYQTIRDKVSFLLTSRISRILQSAELLAASMPSSPQEMTQVAHEICDVVGEEFHAAEASVFFEDRFSTPGVYQCFATTWKRKLEKTQYGINEPHLTSWILTRNQPVTVFDLLDFRDGRKKARIQLEYPGLERCDSPEFESHIHDFFPGVGDQGLPPISFMGAPVTVGSDVLGVIRCSGALAPPYYFAEGELRLLELVAAQVGHFWSNWIVRRESEEENQAWRVFIDRVSKMNQGVQNDVIAGVSDQGRVHREALEIARDVIPGAETLDIRLLDEERNELYYACILGDRWNRGSKQERQARLEFRYSINGPPDSIGAQVVRSGKACAMNDEPDSLYHAPFPDSCAMIVVPLRSRDHVIGVMDIRTSTQRKFPKYAISIAELLGQQLGLYQDLANAMRSLRDAEEELRALLRGQTMTYEDLGHQLKSPVFQAEARIQTALRSKDLPDELWTHLSAIRGLIRKTKRVTMNVRLFAQLANQNIVPSKMTVLDNDKLTGSLIGYASDHERLLGAERQVTFQVERKTFGVLRMHEVRVDYDLLEQALNNVLDNAFKYSFRRSTVRVYGGVAGPGLFYIAVNNRGIRLNPTEVEKAKSRGWRSEAAESTTGEGSGIGLWIVHHIMKALGGELKIHPTTAEDLTEIRLLFPISKGSSH